MKAIQVQLGHAAAEMMLNRYSHLYPDDLDELAVHLDAIRRRADLSRQLGAQRGDGGRSRDRSSGQAVTGPFVESDAWPPTS